MPRPSCCPSLRKTARVGMKEREPCCAPFPLAWDAGPALCLKFAGKRTVAQRWHHQVQQWPVVVPWGPRLPLGHAVGRSVTLLPAIPATATRIQIAIVSTRPLSGAFYYSCFFLLGAAHSRDNIFRTTKQGRAYQPAQQPPEPSPLPARPSIRDPGASSSSPLCRG